MPPIVLNKAVLTPGIRADFATAYDQAYRGMYESLSSMMDLERPSDKRTEIYGYYKTAPYPEIWPRGTPIPSAAFEAVQFSVSNLKWGRKLPWEREDEEDDQLQGLMPRVRQAAVNFGTLDERVFHQIVLGQVNKKLLPLIPNAPDGAGLYSAYEGDGVTARFGRTGGNIVTGLGVSAAHLVKKNIYQGLMAAASFLDTEGEPLWGESIVKGKITVLYSMGIDEVVRTACKGALTSEVITNQAGSENVAAAAIHNVIVEAGLQINLCPSTRITDNKIRIFLGAAPHKPIFVQQRTPVEEHVATADTSDMTRELDQGAVYLRARKGYGLFLPYGTVLLDNA